MGFEFRPLAIPDVLLIEPQVWRDERGFFCETYREAPFRDQEIGPFVQENHSFSRQGVLRGLHYQVRPAGQAKLVTVAAGLIFDVAVDVRPSSATWGQWVGVTLSDANPQWVYIPEGFAHGFCVLSPEAHVTYKVSAYYDPALERGLRWDDPDLGISWPIDAPLVSAKDQRLPSLASLNPG